MKNIDIFDQFTAQISARLYEAFPVPIDFEFSDTSLEGFDDEDTSEVAYDRLVIYEKTLLWLISSGYISSQLTTYDGIHNVVLTAKGLEILKLPQSLEGCGPSFGEEIVGSVKSGALQAAGSMAKSAITKGLSLVLSGA